MDKRPSTKKITLFDLKTTNIIDFGKYDFSDFQIDVTFYMIPDKNDELLKKIKVCNISKNYITCDFYDFIIKNKKLVIDHIKWQEYHDKEFEQRYIKGIKNNDADYFYIFIRDDLPSLFEQY